MASTNSELEAELSNKKICRFCLAQNAKLDSIHTSNTRVKSSATLSLQIMAITSIEVSQDDGMPSFICTDCRLLFEHCYRFKQMCKKGENLLRQFPLTGTWPAPLERPRPPVMCNQPLKKDSNQSPAPMKLLNSTMSMPANVIVENVQVCESSLLTENYSSSTDTAPTIKPRHTYANTQSQAYQVKVENNQELSMDDVRHMIADIGGVEYIENESEAYTVTTITKPKVLNKSSMRILNKCVNMPMEPRMAAPQITRDEAGNVAVVTEILDPNNLETIEVDVVKKPMPVQTNVYPCPYCERSFPLLQLRDIHMVNHTRKRSFQCPECDKSFFSKYDLQKHAVVHTGERPFKCTICDKGFTRGALLHRHERSHTDIPKFICVYCEKPFISRDEMEKHAERHTKKRPFQCGVCNKAFAFKQGLERHEIIHSTDLPFPCQHCNQSFTTARKLARHLVAHAGKRAFPCKYCGKSYLLSHHLSRHLRSHKQGSSTFICNICEDTHQTYESLVDHSLIHASLSLICPLCKETISDFDSVEQHIQAHKASDSFACEFCDLIFLDSSKLQSHIEDDHVIDMVPYKSNDGEMEPDLLQQLLSDDPDPSATPPQPKIRKLNETENKKSLPQQPKPEIKTEQLSPQGKDSHRSSAKSSNSKVKSEQLSPECKESQRSSSNFSTAAKSPKSTAGKRQTRRSVPTEEEDVQQIKVTKKEAEALAKNGRASLKNARSASEAANK